jgi:hypothetical protein
MRIQSTFEGTRNVTAWQPDPLLLELFESVQEEFAKALETRQRLSDLPVEQQMSDLTEQTERIAKLRVAMATLEGAIERHETGVVH